MEKVTVEERPGASEELILTTWKVPNVPPGPQELLRKY